MCQYQLRVCISFKFFPNDQHYESYSVSHAVVKWNIMKDSLVFTISDTIYGSTFFFVTMGFNPADNLGKKNKTKKKKKKIEF
jgi:hypothetical protein